MDKSSEDLREDEIVIADGNKNIRYQPSNPTIQTLFENYKDGDLILSPDFQRRYVWNKLKASSLIESIILNIPLPLIFTAEVDDGEEVVDGQQRLTSIFSYIDGRFPDGEPFKLSRNLKILSKEIGGKPFRDLGKGFQKKIKKCALPIITISRDSQEDIKFEMFERLNTNITTLTPQELRNCLYRGPYNDFLKRMTEYPDFQYIINRPMFKKRMKDVELVLMFCAFHNKPPDHYNTNIPQMLNIDMRDNRNLLPEKVQEIERQFKKSVKLVKHIFGQKAFNIFSIDDENKKGSYSKSLNYGLYQIVMYWFIPYTENQVIPYSDLIREELLNLQIHNQEFIGTLTGAGTNSLTKLRRKFDIWGNTIKGILQYPRTEPRAFSYDLKETLWRQNKTCQICSQRIRSIDDAEIDHIICYWKGGKTIPENGRLTHRLCNRKRGGDQKFYSDRSIDEDVTSSNSKLAQGIRGVKTENSGVFNDHHIYWKEGKTTSENSRIAHRLGKRDRPKDNAVLGVDRNTLKKTSNVNGNFIVANKELLKNSHYLLVSNSEDFWFGVMKSKLDRFKEKYGDSFCLVLYKTGDYDDSYIMPFSAIKILFNPNSEQLTAQGHTRYVGSIFGDSLSLRNEDRVVNIKPYHNAFDLLSKEDIKKSPSSKQMLTY